MTTLEPSSTKAMFDIALRGIRSPTFFLKFSLTVASMCLAAFFCSEDSFFSRSIFLEIPIILLSGATTLFAADAVHKKVRMLRKNRHILSQNEKRTELIVSHLMALSEEEAFILSYSHDMRVKSFFGYLHNPHISSLLHKGLIVAAPSGAVTEYAFTVREAVWKLLETTDVAGNLRDRENFESERNHFMSNLNRAW